MATQTQIQQNYTSLANEFQALQQQVEVATRNCPIDKESALATFRSLLLGFNTLLNRATTLKQEAAKGNFVALESSIKAFTVTVTQALVDATKAQQNCQNLSPTVVQEPKPTAPAPTSPPAANPGAPPANNTTPGINKAQAQAVLKDTTNFDAKKDWRVRLSLSPGADYLYKSNNPGILAPLQNTDGVIFPYTPSVNISYNANYDPTNLTHSNYKIYQYLNSSVDQVTITCDFTAQDTYEANYLLAVIHFFRSVTKMFYGQDQNPKAGTPPPLCYLFGLGQFQFNAHPLAIAQFTYSLPAEVDYIRCNPNDLQEVKVTARQINGPSAMKAPNKPKPTFFDALSGSLQNSRLAQGLSKLGNVIGVNVIPGGGLAKPNTDNTNFNSIIPPGTTEPTYVPTKIQINIICIPIVSRYDISNNFSLQDYARGDLLRGVNRSGGGIW